MSENVIHPPDVPRSDVDIETGSSAHNNYVAACSPGQWHSVASAYITPPAGWVIIAGSNPIVSTSPTVTFSCGGGSSGGCATATPSGKSAGGRLTAASAGVGSKLPHDPPAVQVVSRVELAESAADRGYGRFPRLSGSGGCREWGGGRPWGAPCGCRCRGRRCRRGNADQAVAHGRSDPRVDQARSVEKTEVGQHLAGQARLAHDVGRPGRHPGSALYAESRSPPGRHWRAAYRAARAGSAAGRRRGRGRATPRSPAEPRRSQACTDARGGQARTRLAPWLPGAAGSRAG